MYYEKSYGNKDIFAIEYKINEDHNGVWMMGNCCLYFAGQPIGKNSYTWDLVDLMVILEEFIGNNCCRYAPKLFMLNDKEFSDVIYQICFEENEDNFYQYLPHKRDLRDYMLVLDNTSVFSDTYIIYFVDNDEYTKVWYCQTTEERYSHFKSFVIPLGEAERVLEQAYLDLARLQPILIVEEEAK